MNWCNAWNYTVLWFFNTWTRVQSIEYLNGKCMPIVNSFEVFSCSRKPCPCTLWIIFVMETYPSVLTSPTEKVWTLWRTTSGTVMSSSQIFLRSWCRRLTVFRSSEMETDVCGCTRLSRMKASTLDQWNVFTHNNANRGDCQPMEESMSRLEAKNLIYWRLKSFKQLPCSLTLIRNFCDGEYRFRLFLNDFLTCS